MSHAVRNTPFFHKLHLSACFSEVALLVVQLYASYPRTLFQVPVCLQGCALSERQTMQMNIQ